MYTSRTVIHDDYHVISLFPQNEEELFYMFPKATYPLTSIQIEEGAKSRHYPTVIIHHEEVVAYANLYDHEDDVCWLGNVIVSPQYRGKGVSKYLIEVMAGIAKERLNVNKLKLVCHNTNTRGVLLYMKVGFTPFGVIRIEKPTSEVIAGIRMELEL